MDTINNSNGSTHGATGNGVILSTDVAAAPTGGTTTPVAGLPSGKARVAVSFLLRDTDAELIVISQDILTAMTGNAAYPAPDPTLAILTAARDSYVAAVSAAKDSKIAVNVRKQQRASFIALLRNLAHYVQVASGGDLPTLQGSGFPVQHQPAPIGPLLPPVNLRLTRGTLSGQVIARCGSQPKAGAYQWRCASTATPQTWLPLVTTLRAKTAFDGLIPGAQYNVQVSVIGTAGQSNWSDSAVVMVV
jgi:hypothetical protein